MTTQNPVYASQAKPWLKYYAQKYIDQTLPTLSAFDYVCHRNRNHLNDTALDYYGRKFTYADLIVNVKKTAAALRGVGDAAPTTNLLVRYTFLMKNRIRPRRGRVTPPYREFTGL